MRAAGIHSSYGGVHGKGSTAQSELVLIVLPVVRPLWYFVSYGSYGTKWSANRKLQARSNRKTRWRVLEEYKTRKESDQVSQNRTR
jgi:hypothetical protein